MRKNSKTSSKKNQKKTNNLKSNCSPQTNIPSLPSNIAPVLNPNLNTSGLTESEQKKIEELITHARLEYAKIQTNIIKEKRRELDSLNEQIKEFMGPYMLIGYDLNNNPVEIIAATSQAQHDALLERLRRIMFKINQNIINSNGDDPYGLNS